MAGNSLQILVLMYMTYLISAGKKCYQCTDFRFTTDLSSSNDRKLQAYADTVRDCRCFRRTSYYVKPPQDFNEETGEYFDRHSINPSSCPSLEYRCGIWEGTVNATIFGEKVAMETFSFGCVPKATTPLHDIFCTVVTRNGLETDNNHMQQELKKYFSKNVEDVNFVGKRCVKNTAEEQFSRGFRITSNIWAYILVIAAMTMKVLQ